MPGTLQEAAPMEANPVICELSPFARLSSCHVVCEASLCQTSDRVPGSTVHLSELTVSSRPTFPLASHLFANHRPHFAYL